MEQYIEATPFVRIDLLCDAEFSVWSSKDGKPQELLGPHTSGVRRTSFVVPPGCDGLLVTSPVDCHVRVLSMLNTDYREVPDQTRIVQEDYGEEQDAPVIDVVRAELARLGLQQLYGRTTEDEGNEDDDDFETGSADEPWADYAHPHNMQPDIPDETSDATIDDLLREHLEHTKALYRQLATGGADEPSIERSDPDPDSGTTSEEKPVESP